MKTILRHSVYLGVLLGASSSFAGLPESYGFGARSIGMAGAGMSIVSDWTAPYHNVSGLASPVPPRDLPDAYLPTPQEVCLPGEEKGSWTRKKDKPTSDHFIGFGFNSINPQLEITQENPSALSKRNAELGASELKYGALNLGMVFDLRTLFKTPYGVPIKLGASIALNADGSITKVTDISQRSYQPVVLGRNPQRLSMLIGLGFQVWKDRISLGLGVTNLAKGAGKTELAPISLDPEEKPESQTKLNVKTFSAPIAGITFYQKINRNHSFSIGLAYRGELYLMTDINVFAELPLGIIAQVDTTVISSYDPPIFSAGVSYAYRGYRLAFDVEYRQWSKFQINPTKAFYQVPANFKDILVFRVGTEIDLPYLSKFGLAVRSGYAYIPALTPDQTGITNYLDNNKHVISSGAGIMLLPNSVFYGKTSLDIGVQYQIWEERTTRKAVVDVLPDDSVQPNYRYSARLLMFSVSATFQF